MINPKTVVISAESLPRDEKREIKKDRANPIQPADDRQFCPRTCNPQLKDDSPVIKP